MRIFCPSLSVNPLIIVFFVCSVATEDGTTGIIGVVFGGLATVAAVFSVIVACVACLYQWYTQKRIDRLSKLSGEELGRLYKSNKENRSDVHGFVDYFLRNHLNGYLDRKDDSSALIHEIVHGNVEGAVDCFRATTRWFHEKREDIQKAMEDHKRERSENCYSDIKDRASIRSLIRRYYEEGKIHIKRGQCFDVFDIASRRMKYNTVDVQHLHDCLFRDNRILKFLFHIQLLDFLNFYFQTSLEGKLEEEQYWDRWNGNWPGGRFRSPKFTKFCVYLRAYNEFRNPKIALKFFNLRVRLQENELRLAVKKNKWFCICAGSCKYRLTGVVVWKPRKESGSVEEEESEGELFVGNFREGRVKSIGDDL